jgi:hypothetical protein
MNAVGAQPGLFEPEPPRAVQAPGARGWWGIDTALTHYVVGCVDVDLARRSDLVLTGRLGPSDGERLSRMASQLEQLIILILEDGAPAPGVVWVEQASGKAHEPDLVYAVGIAVTTSYQVLRRELGYAVLVDTVPSATWKSKLAPGAGGWYKTVNEYKVLQWARANGYAGEDYAPVGKNGAARQVMWDHADGRGIAEGARKTFALR